MAPRHHTHAAANEAWPSAERAARRFLRAEWKAHKAEHEDWLLEAQLAFFEAARKRGAPPDEGAAFAIETVKRRALAHVTKTARRTKLDADGAITMTGKAASSRLTKRDARALGARRRGYTFDAKAGRFEPMPDDVELTPALRTKLAGVLGALALLEKVRVYDEAARALGEASSIPRELAETIEAMHLAHARYAPDLEGAWKAAAETLDRAIHEAKCVEPTWKHVDPVALVRAELLPGGLLERDPDPKIAAMLPWIDDTEIRALLHRTTLGGGGGRASKGKATIAQAVVRLLNAKRERAGLVPWGSPADAGLKSRRANSRAKRTAS